MFETFDFEERAKAVALLENSLSRDVRWTELINEAGSDPEQLIALMTAAPDMPLLIKVRLATITNRLESTDVRDAFNRRAAPFGDVCAAGPMN